MDTFVLTIAIRGFIATCLAAGGIYALNRGYNLFVNKVGLQPDESVLIFGKTRISVKSVGSLVMLTASFWGYLSLQCVPRIESERLRVTSISNQAKMLAELREAITRAILTSQDQEMPQTVLQASLKTTIDTPPLIPPKTARVIEYIYNGDRLVAVRGTDLTTKFQYDPAGRLTALADPDGNTTTTYSYDPLGRRLSETRTDATTTTYTYDADGRIATIVTTPRTQKRQ